MHHKALESLNLCWFLVSIDLMSFGDKSVFIAIFWFFVSAAISVGGGWRFKHCCVCKWRWWILAPGLCLVLHSLKMVLQWFAVEPISYAGLCRWKRDSMVLLIRYFANHYIPSNFFITTTVFSTSMTKRRRLLIILLSNFPFFTSFSSFATIVKLFIWCRKFFWFFAFKFSRDLELKFLFTKHSVQLWSKIQDLLHIFEFPLAGFQVWHFVSILTRKVNAFFIPFLLGMICA